MMRFFSKSIIVVRSITLRILQLVLGSRCSFEDFDSLPATANRGQIVAYFAEQFTAFSLKTMTEALHLGQAHALLLDLPPAIEPSNAGGIIRILRSPAASSPALRMSATSGSLRDRLVRFAFQLNNELSSVLDVKRDIKITRIDGRLELAPLMVATDPGDWPEKFTRSLSTHVRHVVELAARRQASNTFHFQTPLLSFIVPVFNASSEHLDALLRSFRQQSESVAELILSDDRSTSSETTEWLEAHEATPNVTIVRNAAQSGISGATNAGIAVARGEWVSFIDHDDALFPFSVGEIARTIHDNPDCDLIYTDEIITDENLGVVGYFLKPAWDPVLLSGVNYVNHLSIYRKSIVLDCGGLRSDFDGSQDYDLLLRYTARIRGSSIRHLPFPAYLWRRSETAYSVRFLEKATKNARKSLSERFSTGHALEVVGAVDPNLHRIRFDEGRTIWPKVSIVIPSRDAPDLIRGVLEGLFERTDYPALEVVIIDNGTTNGQTFEIYERYELTRDFRVIIEPSEFNFSAAVNKGIRQTQADLVLLLNNDIEIRSADWLKEMVSCFDYDDVGIVGAKLLYPNGNLQHAGVIAGLGQLAGHWFIDEEANFPGPMGRLWVRQTMSCVTGAAMLVSRKCIEVVGLFDEANFAIAYNDVDFCLRATNAGFRVVWTPFALMIHHESASRGSDEAPAKIDRFRREQANLRRIHATDLLEDRALNPWYCRMYSHPTYLLRRELPESR